MLQKAAVETEAQSARTRIDRAGVLPVYLFGDVTPGGTKSDQGRKRLAVNKLRSQLDWILSRHELVPIPQLLKGGESGKQASIAFIGGYTGQIRYAVPLIDSLGIPGHLFAPLNRIGQPGRLRLTDLETLKISHQMRLELDFSSFLPPTSRELATAVNNANMVFRRVGGRRPRFISIAGSSVPRHYRFLFSQFGFAGAISVNIPFHQQHDGFWLLKASKPSWRKRFQFPL